jgi:hypothetical protein
MYESSSLPYGTRKYTYESYMTVPVILLHTVLYFILIYIDHYSLFAHWLVIRQILWSFIKIESKIIGYVGTIWFMFDNS